MTTETEKRIAPKGKEQIKKCLINNKTKETFKNDLQKMTWVNEISSKQFDSAYEDFV